ncbi:MAG TPA: hypothetical protein VJL34_07650 [Anaerolineales bacterium]|nr:hypothetical protein [Anaerolineales bacterium]
MVKRAESPGGSSTRPVSENSSLPSLDRVADPGALGIDVRPDPKLIAAGWERRFVADPPRLREAVELYTELGFEVLAEPVRVSELNPGCADCQLVLSRLFVTIYTRRK